MSSETEFEIINPWSADDDWVGVTRWLPDGPPGEVISFDDSWQVERIAHQGEQGDEWDGEVAAVVLLEDGRWLTFETFYAPTGNGFCHDAYGGNAEVLVHPSYESAVRWGLTDEWRQRFGIDAS